eukprot:scaffold345153_cov18-Prasinocladus_malaysianus.AAC.1
MSGLDGGAVNIGIGSRYRYVLASSSCRDVGDSGHGGFAVHCPLLCLSLWLAQCFRAKTALEQVLSRSGRRGAEFLYIDHRDKCRKKHHYLSYS